jgi:hypothetical protein
MGWYQCSCGFITEMIPQFGGMIVSVSHLHSSALVDGTSAIVRMARIPDPFPACQLSCEPPNQVSSPSHTEKPARLEQRAA